MRSRVRIASASGSERGPGLLPRVLFTVRTGNSKQRQEFYRLCRVLGVVAVPVQEHGAADDCSHCLATVVHYHVCVHGHTTTYDCTGLGTALDRLSDCDALIVNWQLAVSCRVGFIGAGTGAEKIKTGHNPAAKRKPSRDNDGMASYAIARKEVKENVHISPVQTVSQG